jgi:uncharacterized protein YllA (UPF0747 family)
MTTKTNDMKETLVALQTPPFFLVIQGDQAGLVGGPNPHHTPPSIDFKIKKIFY